MIFGFRCGALLESHNRFSSFARTVFWDAGRVARCSSKHQVGRWALSAVELAEMSDFNQVEGSVGCFGS